MSKHRKPLADMTVDAYALQILALDLATVPSAHRARAMSLFVATMSTANLAPTA